MKRSLVKDEADRKVQIMQAMLAGPEDWAGGKAKAFAGASS